MVENKQKTKTSFLNKPFDLNRNGKIDPAEAALIMMVIDDVNEAEKKRPIITNYEKVVDIDDLDIEGI